MYLAHQRIPGGRRYILRESVPEGPRLVSRDLFDLGPDPTRAIVYPGENSFHFSEELVRALSELGVRDIDRRLERVFLPFLKPHVRRVVEQMTRLGRRKSRDLSGPAMARAQERLHRFDRRRFFYLRYGRMDRPEAVNRPHRFLNVLVDMCRDEMEYFFRGMEVQLRTRERRQYVYLALDMERHFPGDFARLFPQGLDEDRLDEAFLSELCRLNADEAFLDHPPAGLSEYLVRYAVMWFDFEFGQRPPQARIFEEFARERRAWRPPAPSGPDLDRSCRVFGLTVAQWRGTSRDELGRIYRRLALVCHPDQGGDPERFIELNQAYERLAGGRPD